jgi:multidrug efflux system membrane fusion protein
MSSEGVEPQPAAIAPAVVDGRRKRFVIVLASLIGAFLAWEVLTRFVAYTGDAYVRADLISIAPQVTGPIVAVHIHDNQTVRRGDLLVSIDPTPFRLEVAVRQAQIRESEAQMAAARDAIAVTKDQEGATAAALQLAVATQRRVAVLSKEGDVTRQALDDTDETMQRSESDVASAKASIAKKQQTLDMQAAAIAQRRAELGEAQWRLDRTELHAPTDGPINNLTVRVGDTARAETPLIGLVDATSWRIIANYPQSYLPHLKIGGTAWVWLDSHPWRFHRARITGIGRAISRDPAPAELLPYVVPTTDWIRLQRRFPVTLVLEEPPSDLTLYMGADARAVIFP